MAILTLRGSMARPRKAQYPITAEEALRLALPGKRKEYRMRLVREWLRVNLALRLWKTPTAEECQAEFDLWSEKQFASPDHVTFISGELKRFIPHFTAANRKKRAETAAAKRWEKKS